MSVVALKEEDGIWVGLVGPEVMNVKVATKHRDNLRIIDADEVWFVAADKVPDGASLNHLWPFEVPPGAAKLQYLTAAWRLELLWTMPMGVLGMR